MLISGMVTIFSIAFTMTLRQSAFSAVGASVELAALIFHDPARGEVVAVTRAEPGWRRMGVDLPLSFRPITKLTKRDIIEAAVHFSCQRTSGEIIIADDGSAGPDGANCRKSDSTAGNRAESIGSGTSGKGMAVREGMKACQEEIAAFADSGVHSICDALAMIEAIDLETKLPTDRGK